MALTLYFVVSFFNLSLFYILIFSAITGIIFGKVFCRWICPIGFVFEMLIGVSEKSKQQIYMYHKMGCPIAWISGFLNKFSLLKVKNNSDQCVECGLCDKVCYITSNNKEYSLYKEDKKKPATHFNCSKCLECVTECPTNSLKYKL